MWIVMTSAAKMPNSCWGRYRNVAVVSCRYDIATSGGPAMISQRAKGVFQPLGALRAIIPLGRFSVGKTERCAYQRALREAKGIADQLNNAQPTALPAELFTFGGSA